MTEDEALELHTTAQQMQAEGRHEKALAVLEQVADFFASADGAQSPDLANVLADKAESLLALCRYQMAEVTAGQAASILQGIADLLDPESRQALLPRVLSIWGTALRELGRYQEAETPLLAAIREAESGSDAEQVANHLNDYGVLCKYWRKFEEAESAYRRALAILEQEFGAGSLETATIYHNLGGLEHSRGNYGAGEPLGRKAYEIRCKLLGDDHEETVADAVAWGGLLDGLNRQTESLPIYERALSFYELRLGAGHFEVAATLNNLGMAYEALGRHDEAVAALQRAVHIKLKIFESPDHPEVRLTQANLDSLQAGATERNNNE